jgi:hypothetical protein
VELVGCDVEPPHVKVRLQTSRAPDLAEWAAAHVSDVFRQVYNLEVAVKREQA